MTYCSKCGNQNLDDAQFCNKCGAPLQGQVIDQKKEWDNRCEDECAGGKRGASVFWGVIVTLIGFAIILWVLNESDVDLPSWIEDLNIGLLIGIVIAIALIVTGIKIIITKSKSQ